ncbi:MAG: ATP-binding protein [Fibrobacterota bacterium]
MKFLNRSEELTRLNTLAKRNDGGLAVIWGRRRAGKTRLLTEWVDRHGGCYLVADRSAPDIQRQYLAEELSTRLPGFNEVVYPTWAAFLNRLAADAAQKGFKGPVVLDELPYLVEHSPELPSVLQRFVDHDAKKAGLILAIAGSSQRMMQGIVLNRTAPLFGRAGENLKIRPLKAGYLLDTLAKNPVDAVEWYALFGGIPYYWELALASGMENTVQVADRLVLSPLGVLHSEPERLLSEEMPSASFARPVLDAIGMGAHRVSEIAGRIGVPATALAPSLTRLMDMDLCVREVPFGESEKSGKKSQYRLIDPFLRFWFKVVGPHRSLLSHAPARVRIELFKKTAPALCAESWEELCRDAVPSLEKGSPVSGFGPALRYWTPNGPEWDIVAASQDGSTLLLGEAKWSKKPFTPNEIIRTLNELKAKGIPNKLQGRYNKAIYCVFVPVFDKTLKTQRDCAVINAKTVLDSLRTAD